MTKAQKIITQAAYTMGSIAFANGIQCAPALDKMFQERMAGRQVGDPRTIPEMKAWISGWTAANLAA